MWTILLVVACLAEHAGFVRPAAAQQSDFDVQTVAPVDKSAKFGPLSNASTPAVAEFLERVHDRISSDWEPDTLPARAEFSVRLVIASAGTFRNVRLSDSSGVAQTDFALLEAVNECSMCEQSVPSILKNQDWKLTVVPNERTHGWDCAKAFFAHFPDERKKVVVWHLIPLEALNCLPGLDPAVIHCPENLRAIKISFRNGNEIQSARREWVNFLRPDDHLTLQKLKAKATLIETKYAAMFEPSELQLANLSADTLSTSSRRSADIEPRFVPGTDEYIRSKLRLPETTEESDRQCALSGYAASFYSAYKLSFDAVIDRKVEIKNKSLLLDKFSDDLSLAVDYDREQKLYRVQPSKAGRSMYESSCKIGSADGKNAAIKEAVEYLNHDEPTLSPSKTHDVPEYHKRFVAATEAATRLRASAIGEKPETADDVINQLRRSFIKQ